MGRLGEHPHVVTVFDAGEEDGQLYIVSQLMAGGSLEDHLVRAEGHRLPIEEILRIAEHVCRALEHAHRRGVVHRDVKPANVWLAGDRTAKLGDFGLATTLSRARLNSDGLVLGTVGYMAPEQAMGDAPDPRSDLYAIGAMVYELVTGRPPFTGDDAVSVV